MAETEGTGLPVPSPERRPALDVGRRFRTDEVDAILRRATTHDVHGGLQAPDDATLGDLMAAAEEVGLDPALVRRAASVRLDPGGGVAAALLGAPDHREVRARASGTLPEARQELVRAAEEILKARGKVLESDPGVFVWREDHVYGRTTVALESDDDGTEVRVSADRAGHYAGMVLAGLAGWAGLSALTPVGALLGTLGPLGVLGGFIAIPLLLARPFWIRSDRATHGRLERLAMEMASITEAGSPPALPSGQDGEA